MDFITYNSTILILLAMNYTKMNLFEKPNVAVIIITILEILSKNMVHIENVSKFLYLLRLWTH
jgi:hypothetical protein